MRADGPAGLRMRDVLTPDFSPLRPTLRKSTLVTGDFGVIESFRLPEIGVS